MLTEAAQLLSFSQRRPKLRKDDYRRLFFAQAMMAEAYIANEDGPRALDIARQALANQRQYNADVIIDEVYGLYLLGQAQTLCGQYAAAEASLQEDLALLQQLSEGAFNEDATLYMADVYEYLARNAYRQYAASTQPADLEVAQRYSEKALELLEMVWRNFDNQEDLRYSFYEYQGIFEIALLIQETQFRHTGDFKYLQAAFRLAEITKNVQMRSTLRKPLLAQQLGVPQQVLDKEQAMEKQIFSLEYQVQSSAAQNTALEDSLLRLRAQLLDLREKLKADFPNFNYELNTLHPIDWPALREQLRQSGQTLVYYVSTRDYLFTLVMGEKGQNISVQSLRSDSLQNLVNEFRAALTRSPQQPTDEDLLTLQRTGHQLYNLLLAPNAQLLSKRLLIVPDAALEILPFAALLTQPSTLAAADGYKGWPFVAKKYAISYAYALDLLQQPGKKQQREVKPQILAFAPDFSTFSSQEQQALSIRNDGSIFENMAEARQISHYFKTRLLEGKSASLSRFLEDSPRYAVLHLATHASADAAVGEYSYLSFSPNDDGSSHHLHAQDIYPLELGAELVVLSACETGLGEWRRGEGVVGLERAFVYAGAKSLISTHWKVSDKASSLLMDYMYAQLAEGRPKDVALQQAQAQFLQEQDDWLLHPYFWAGFTLKGSTSPLALQAPRIWWKVLLWGLGAGVLLWMGAWAYNRRRKATA